MKISFMEYVVGKNMILDINIITGTNQLICRHNDVIDGTIFLPTISHLILLFNFFTIGTTHLCKGGRPILNNIIIITPGKNPKIIDIRDIQVANSWNMKYLMALILHSCIIFTVTYKVEPNNLIQKFKKVGDIKNIANKANKNIIVLKL